MLNFLQKKLKKWKSNLIIIPSKTENKLIKFSDFETKNKSKPINFESENLSIGLQKLYEILKS